MIEKLYNNMEQQQKKYTIKDFRKIEAVIKYHEAAKGFCIALGAAASQFEQADKSLKKLHDAIKKDVSGGVVNKNQNNDEN